MEDALIRENRTTDEDAGYNVRSGTPGKEYDVYVLTFPDGKRYVGMTGRDVEARWLNGRGYGENRRLNRAIRETGFENVRKEHFSYPLTRDSAELIEASLIHYFDSTNEENGYNRSSGVFPGCGPAKSAQQIAHLRKVNRGQKRNAEICTRIGNTHRKPIRCVTTGEIFPGIHEAAEATGTDCTSISKVCHGKRKYAGGMQWEFPK